MFLQSCKKHGCTDSNALNYSYGAEADDGSCILKEDIEDFNNLDIVIEEFSVTFGPSHSDIYTPSFFVQEGDLVIIEVETGTTVNFWSALPYMLGNDAYIEGEYSDSWSGIKISSYYSSGNPAVWSSPTTYNFRAALIKHNGLIKNPSIADMTIDEISKLN